MGVDGMAYHLVPCKREQGYLLPPSLEEWLPEQALVHPGCGGADGPERVLRRLPGRRLGSSGLRPWDDGGLTPTQRRSKWSIWGGISH